MDKPQSATFTISADTPQELARLLRRIADALDEGGSGVVPPETPPGEGPEAFEPWRFPARSSPWPASPSFVSWYRHNGRDFLERLTPEAAQAVSFVARHAPRVPVADLARELDKTPGPQLAGALSSIGYAWKALDAPGPPFQRVRSHYEMDPLLASEIVRLWDWLASSTPDGAAAGERAGADEGEDMARRSETSAAPRAPRP